MMDKEKSGQQHKSSGIALIVFNALVLVITTGGNGLSALEIPGLFLSSTGDISDKYYVNITPASWTFSIWAFIYVAQFVFVGYTLSLICRRGPDNYLYLSPQGMIPSATYWSYMIANVGNLGWLFLWDREFVVASGILIALLAFLLLMATGFTLRGLYMTTQELKANGQSKEIWLSRVLVQNALAFYTTWVCIATLINLAVVLTYVLGMPQETAGTISLGILAGELVVWFLLDVSVLARYSNYVIMPYVVVIVALTGSIEKNFVAWETNSLFSVILLILASATFLVKLISLCYRNRASSKDTDSMISNK